MGDRKQQQAAKAAFKVKYDKCLELCKMKAKRFRTVEKQEGGTARATTTTSISKEDCRCFGCGVWWSDCVQEGIEQFLFSSPCWEATTFKLDGREHLKHVTVAPCDLTGYGALQTTAGGVR